jgi:uncharacterized repeat protein (TIGR03803 family)
MTMLFLRACLTPRYTLGGSWGYSVLYRFRGGSDGEIPQAGLVIGRNGELHGTTIYGGSSSCAFGCGTVFSLTPPASPSETWREMIVHAFTGAPDGANPYTGLVMSNVIGVLFGVTGGGGNSACACGTVFALEPPPISGDCWREVVLHNFGGGKSGSDPQATPVLGTNGVLYGTTLLGGASSTSTECCGTVFQLAL